MYAYCAHSLVMRDKKNEKQWRKLPMTTAQIALSVIMIVASLFLIVVVHRLRLLVDFLPQCTAFFRR